MILAYRVFGTILYPFLFIFLFLRIIFKKEDPKRFLEKILISNFNPVEKGQCKLIWFHASSLGEFKSIIPIIEKLNNNQNLKFLVTTTTLSSSNLAQKELKRFNNASHRFFPFDIDFLIEKFLKLWRPDRIFLVDSEIWPNLILKAEKLQIPIALINARITRKSFYRWMMFPKVAKRIFGIFSLCLCSSNETKGYLEKLHANNIHFKGNIKLIGNLNSQKIHNINENILSERKFWFAASTHEGEDALCIKTHLKLKKEFSEIITIIAPRHINRVREIKSLSKKYDLNLQILNNKNELISKDKDIIIVNHYGVLQNYFKYAKSVFLGKSAIAKFKNNGGQNPIEAAKLNCKIYHGPYVYNFKETYEVLSNYNISQKIENFEELYKNLIIDLQDNQKQKIQNTNIINDLGRNTLTDTLKILDSFLFKND